MEAARSGSARRCWLMSINATPASHEDVDREEGDAFFRSVTLKTGRTRGGYSWRGRSAVAARFPVVFHARYERYGV